MSKKIVSVPSELKELIPGFLANRKADITEIQKLISENNLTDIGRIGHKIKGSAGGYGFDELSLLGAQMEDSAKANNINEIKSILLKIIDIVENSEIQYVD